MKGKNNALLSQFILSEIFSADMEIKTKRRCKESTFQQILRSIL
jgi:hypothetical protein